VQGRKGSDESGTMSRDGFWRHKAHVTGQYDLVLLGDSRVYRGISPEAVAAAVGDLRVLNFGWSAAGLGGVLMPAAEARLDPQGRRWVGLGVTAHGLSERAVGNAQYRRFAALPAPSPRTQALERVLDRHFASLLPEQVDELQEQIASEGVDRYIERFHSNGWVASRTEPEDPSRALDYYRSMLSRRPVSPQVLDSLCSKISAWVGEGVQVFAFEPPVAPAMRHLEAEIAGFDAAAVQAAIESAGGTWLVPAGAPYRSYDGSHLPEDEALRYSTALGEALST